MADIKWIKIYVDMFDHKKIKFIRKLPEGNDVLLCWVMLLASAGKCNMGGHIFLTADIPYTAEMLADEFCMPTNTVRLALETFCKLNMVSLDNGIYVEGWEEYQNIDGMEKIRMQNRERAKKHYDNKKIKRLEENSNVRTNVRITQPNATEIELDRELELDKKNNTIKSKNLFEQLKERIFQYTSVPELQEALIQFVAHRKAINKPIKTIYTINLLLKELDKHSDKVGVVNQSIANGWQGLFEIKNNSNVRFVEKEKESGNIFKRMMKEEGLC